ncbi:MAG: bifunctional methylenetetrahydrofolate dehydrogenase/methenyltetrahydrofolate cyclohydrolase FolD [Clostridia bacterium]|nr:bifunctional methylenetetrahydrofolate dehydrogenase/methenyltetrahydrofolate cyclohydrolase FolD [Clostridia bacterium]MBR5772350.1 bifunctional methylenetetrahydrofolate dehydrogenase/methenyltetrahydrofolate cyclohydrolase FolD [Clostridia bacterium]
MAKIIDGKQIRDSVLDRLREQVSALKAGGKNPCLCVIIVGDDTASKVYVNNKKKACESIGIESKEYALPESTTTEELLGLIDKLNADSSITGILCQMPVPAHIDSKAVLERISPYKDVDCFHPFNVGKLSQGDNVFLPCTPAGMVEMLDYMGVEIAGKHCVIIGRSDIVGKPMAMLMLQRDATVTVCHSKTKNLADITRTADIVVVAVKKPYFLKSDMIKEGAVVLDVGINRNAEGKICGDVDFEDCKEKASMITPVPGGVGPMTIAMLMNNTVIAAKTF